MDFSKVSVEVRKQSGKGGARKVRAAGKVPGVLYGNKGEPIAVTFDEKTLLQSLDKERRRNTVFSLTVAGDGKNEQVTAMIRDAQIDPLSRRLMHVDFLRVDLDQEVTRHRSADPDRQGDRHGQRRQPAPEHARDPDRGEAGGDPDQARGRRHRRWTSATRSTSATSSWRRACARCSTPRKRSRRSSRRRPRRPRPRRRRSRARCRPRALRLPLVARLPRAGEPRKGAAGPAKGGAAAAPAKKEGEKKGK